MVLLRANVAEVASFARLAAADDAGVRYLLPTRNRNDQSILCEADRMARALEGLLEVRQALRTAGRTDDLADLAGIIAVLRSWLDEGVYKPL